MDGTPGVLVSWANMKTNQKTNKKTKDESSTPADLNNPTIHPSSIVPLTKEDQSNHPSAHLAKPATRNLQPATLVAEPSTLADGLPRDPLINPTIHESNNPPAHPAEPATCNLQPATLAVSPITDNCSLITSHPSPLPPTIIPTASAHKARRRGRIARLPQHARDLVNRMLRNGIPYKNIVAALDDLGFTVLDRNISSWATGGYKDWLLEQDLVLQNRLDQDHLIDHLRRDDAPELPEVGLQAAATRLSQILLQKTATTADVESNLESYERMVSLLCRLNRELGPLQQQRDNSQRSLGRAHDPVRIKDCDQSSALQMERSYSNPGEDSELAKPAEAPELPPPSTSDFLAQCDEEDEEFREKLRQVRLEATLKAFNPAPKPNPKSSPS